VYGDALHHGGNSRCSRDSGSAREIVQPQRRIAGEQRIEPFVDPTLEQLLDDLTFPPQPAARWARRTSTGHRYGSGVHESFDGPWTHAKELLQDRTTLATGEQDAELVCAYAAFSTSHTDSSCGGDGTEEGGLVMA
jgi:hypothetical protein